MYAYLMAGRKVVKVIKILKTRAKITHSGDTQSPIPTPARAPGSASKGEDASEVAGETPSAGTGGADKPEDSRKGGDLSEKEGEGGAEKLAESREGGDLPEKEGEGGAEKLADSREGGDLSEKVEVAPTIAATDPSLLYESYWRVDAALDAAANVESEGKEPAWAWTSNNHTWSQEASWEDQTWKSFNSDSWGTWDSSWDRSWWGQPEPWWQHGWSSWHGPRDTPPATPQCHLKRSWSGTSEHSSGADSTDVEALSEQLSRCNTGANLAAAFNEALSPQESATPKDPAAAVAGAHGSPAGSNTAKNRSNQQQLVCVPPPEQQNSTQPDAPNKEPDEPNHTKPAGTNRDLDAEIEEGIKQLERELGDFLAGDADAEEKKKAEEATKKKLAAHARYMRYSRSVTSQGLKHCSVLLPL